MVVQATDPVVQAVRLLHDAQVQFVYPSNLADLSRDPGGTRWRSELPDLVQTAAKHWHLSLGPVYATSHVSYVAPALRRDGQPVVLKVGFPHHEADHEADALRVWNGDGAVQLFDEHGATNSLLLERCDPGTPLHEIRADDALDVYVDVLPRLWKPAEARFATLAAEADLWAESMKQHRSAGSGIHRDGTIVRAITLCADLATSQGECVLVHQDLHAGNVLRSTRQPWLAIDPKPLVGEREFAVASIARSNELGHSRVAVWRRLDTLCRRLGLDHDRAWGWTFVQTVAWGLDVKSTRHHETVQWLLDGRPD